MKTKGITIIVAIAVLLFACAETKKNDEEKKNVENETTETVIEYPVEKATVMFEMFYTSDRGAILLFTDDDGNDYEFYEGDSNAEGIDFFHNSEPNVSADEFSDVRFDIEYQVMPCQFYDGSTAEYFEMEVPVLISIERL